LVVHLAPDALEVHKDIQEWWTQVKEDTDSCPAFDPIGPNICIVAAENWQVVRNQLRSHPEILSWRS
jgi:hypothetical protein